MAYLFNTPDEQQAMLERIGVAGIDELFDQIPTHLRLGRPLDLPPAETEMALEAEISARLKSDSAQSSKPCFLGGGVYDHFIPAAVDEVVSRGEFYTAYTPYQAEASQGSLQAFYEFQTLVCQLTGMDVSNASLYEGGTAVSEAAFMAMRVTRRHQKIVVLGSVHPEYREVLATYLGHLGCEIRVVPIPNGYAQMEDVAQAIDEETACVIIQQPNFLGCLEEADAISELAHRYGALLVTACDPISLGVLRRPSEYGTDIAVAEGQPLGIPLQFGGPLLGILACRQEFMRKMPGRLIGETVDRHGQRCYALNLQAREQHIRREKATSNICTNQGLLALRATVYLSLMGPQGLREAAENSSRKAHYAAWQLKERAGLSLLVDRPFLREFAIECDQPHQVVQRASEAGFDIGPELSQFELPGLETSSRGVLIAVTEKRTKEEIDGLVDALTA